MFQYNLPEMSSTGRNLQYCSGVIGILNTSIKILGKNTLSNIDHPIGDIGSGMVSLTLALHQTVHLLRGIEACSRTGRDCSM